jgi:hypothetical protein
MSTTNIIHAVLLSLVVVYGITESKLFSMLRITFEAVVYHRGSTFMQGFIYCPFCVGFWASLALGLLHGAAFSEMFVVPSIVVCVLLAKRDLIRPPYDAEKPGVQDVAQWMSALEDTK